jgi:heme/copper-type cytochrome/quinol oxidase subunit 2
MTPRLLVVAWTCALLLGGASDLHACPVCFRIEDAAATNGVYAAVAVLLAVTGGVLGGCAAFLVNFVRRARRAAVSEAETRP